MKRILVTGFIVGLAAVGLTAAPAQAYNDAACFGQVHKSINKDGALGLMNVGEAVQLLGGPGKNMTAQGLCGD